MSVAVLISIRPEWCGKIANGQKTIEVRKTRPKLKTPFKCYIYETKAINHYSILVDLDGVQKTVYEKGRGKIIGEFICDRIVKAECGQYCRLLSTLYTQILPHELFNYANYKSVYGWHISDLVIYDKPKELSEFYSKAPCQYWHGNMTSILDQCFYEYPCENILDRGICQGKRMSRPPRSWCYVEGV